jgi:hypothetical protein
MQCLVLLLGSREHAAIRLATAVADLLAELDVWPAVRLVGSHPEACQAAEQTLLACLPGLDLGLRQPEAAGRAPVQAMRDVIAEMRRPSAARPGQRALHPS